MTTPFFAVVPAAYARTLFCRITEIVNRLGPQVILNVLLQQQRAQKGLVLPRASHSSEIALSAQATCMSGIVCRLGLLGVVCAMHARAMHACLFAFVHRVLCVVISLAFMNACVHVRVVARWLADVHRQSLCAHSKDWRCRAQVTLARSPCRAHVACIQRLRQRQSFSRTLLSQFSQKPYICHPYMSRA